MMLAKYIDAEPKNIARTAQSAAGAAFDSAVVRFAAASASLATSLSANGLASPKLSPLAFETGARARKIMAKTKLLPHATAEAIDKPKHIEITLRYLRQD